MHYIGPTNFVLVAQSSRFTEVGSHGKLRRTGKQSSSAPIYEAFYNTVFEKDNLEAAMLRLSTNHGILRLPNEQW